jgi:hypothetical protein
VTHISCHGSAGSKALAWALASPQATPLDQKIPVQIFGSPWGGRRHCKSQAFTNTDLPRQVPKWDILYETDYGPPLVRIMPGTCGCAASLKRRSGLSNRATRARSCPARSWSSYCRSQTDEPRGSRWRRDLCLRPCVQPWLELGKLCHWRLWR